MSRRRYQFAFLALGWLILAGILFQRGLGGLRNGYAHAEQRLAHLGQRLSDAEGAARQRARGGVTRAEELQRVEPGVTSMDSLRKPRKVLFGAYDGGFPTTFAGLEDFETRIDRRFPIVSFYQAWGDRPDQAHFPTRVV